MSVINKVLKDLDERQPLSSEQEKYSIDAVDKHPPPKDHARLAMYLVAGVLVVAAAGYYFWLLSQVPDEKAYQPMTASVTPVTPVTQQSKVVEDEAIEPESEEFEVIEPRVPVQPVEALVITDKPVEKLAEKMPAKQQAKPEVKPEEASYLPLKDDGKPVKVTSSASKPEARSKSKAEIVVVKTRKSGLELAREMLSGGRLTEAEKLLKTLISEKPASLPARELLAGLLLRNNRLEEAAAEIAMARKYYPRSDNLVLLQAKMLLAKGEQQQVMSLLQQHVQTTKASSKSRALLASLFQQAGRHADAYTLYNRLAQQQPANEEYWMGLAISLDGLGQPAKARQAYARALQSVRLSAALREYAIKRINAIDLQGN